MRRNMLGLLMVVFVLIGASAPLFAHHSFAAEYDKKQPIKFSGLVTKVEWLNPHIYYYVDVKDAGGKVINYAVEGGTPNTLYRKGWRKDSLKVGETITVEGFRAKNGSNHVNGSKVTLSSGKRLFDGSADESAEQ